MTDDSMIRRKDSKIIRQLGKIAVGIRKILECNEDFLLVLSSPFFRFSNNFVLKYLFRKVSHYITAIEISRYNRQKYAYITFQSRYEKIRPTPSKQR